MSVYVSFSYVLVQGMCLHGKDESWYNMSFFNSGIYVHDGNGNPVNDPARRLDITYNRLNKPERVVTSQSDWMRYSYSPTGTNFRRNNAFLH